MIQIRPPILRTVLPHLMCVRVCVLFEDDENCTTGLDICSAAVPRSVIMTM